MRILFVEPYPLSRIRFRSYGFITKLMIQHQVTVIALCSNKREAEDVRELQTKGIDIIAIQDKRIVKLFRVMRSLGAKIPLQVAFDASTALGEMITIQAQKGNYDVLHIEHIRALGALPDNLPIPIVWDAVDCISRLYDQGARFGATSMMRFLGKREARRIQEYERKQLQRFRHILVTSERERQGLLDLVEDNQTITLKSPLSQITVLPFGIDQQYFQYYTGERDPETLVFSGKMSFHANVAGVLHLVEHIMPLIWRQRPNVRLIIAGGSPPPSIQILAREPRIEVTGYVPDMRPYIAHAQVSVCPLPYAVGVQSKVLEAMSMGTPVVASSHAVGGLIEPRIGEDVLMADEPQAFANAVLHLLNNQELWSKLSKNGVAYIANKYNWDRIIQQLTFVYAEAVELSQGVHEKVVDEIGVRPSLL